MIHEWVRQEIYNLQVRVEKLEKCTMDKPCPECGAKAERDDKGIMPEILQQTIADTRQQTARECAKIVLWRRGNYRNNEYAGLTDAADAILRKYVIEGK